MFYVLLITLSACGSLSSTGSPPAPAQGTTTAATAAGNQSSAPAAATAAPSVSDTTSPATAGGAVTSEISVFAGMAFVESFTELGKSFEAENPGVKVNLSFEPSGDQAKQINEGATPDVFASVSRRAMDNVVQAGKIISGTERIFVDNRLVVVYPKDNPAKLQTLQDLGKPGVKIILGKPDSTTGASTLEFLGKAAALPEFGATYSETVQANVVSYGDTARDVIDKIMRNEGDVGIVWTSEVTPRTGAYVGQISIPRKLNSIQSYPIAPIKDSANPAEAQKFIDYVFSPKGQAILIKYGFIVALQSQ
jgi:molybdate transport system substrate-binding protein